MDQVIYLITIKLGIYGIKQLSIVIMSNYRVTIMIYTGLMGLLKFIGFILIFVR
jgi:hypothetical protein